MKLYALTEDRKNIATFNAELSDDAKQRVMKQIDYVCKCQRLVLEFANYDEESIKESLAIFNYLAPSKVEIDYDSINAINIPFVKKSASEKEERYRKVYRADVAIKEYPFIYYIMFDEEGNIKPNIVNNLAKYLNNESTEEMNTLAAKLRMDSIDYTINFEYIYKIVEEFFKSLKISLESIDLPSNNLDERLEQAESLKKISEYIEENYEYYHEEEIDDEDYEDYETKQEKNIRTYTLGRL